MPNLYAFSADEVNRTPWPSGSGSSCELTLWPDGSSLAAGNFTVRLSLDQVDRSGRVPSLSGYEHVIAALGERGLQLSHGDDSRDTFLRCGETGTFQGEWATQVGDLDASVSFLCICARRGHARATMQTVKLGQRDLREAQASPLGLLYVSRGALTARATNEEDPFELVAGDGIFVTESRAGDEWALVGDTPDTELVWAQIDFQ